MATQVTALPQTHGGHAEALQQIFDICDDVSARLNTPDQHLPVEVPSSILPDSALFEVLKARLESMTGMRFTLYESGAEGTWFFPAAAPMSSESPANSVDTAVGLTGGAQSVSASTPGTGDVASTNKKIPRPMNAFMIYRLRHHSIVAGENPGMHNNDISKKIGLQWRSEKPEVVEAFKKEAEDQKRQHAIDHPGYRYQPRKPSEKKKRMTKNKLAKLAAESGSTNLTMDMTNVPAQHANVPAQLANVPAQLDLSDQLYDPLAGEQLSFDMIPENWDSAIVARSSPLDGSNYGISSDLAGAWANAATFPMASQPDTQQDTSDAEQDRQRILDAVFEAAARQFLNFEEFGVEGCSF